MPFKQKLVKETGLPENILPGSYQIIGDILLLKFMKIRSMKQKRTVAKAIMKLLPYVKTVCEIKSVKGEFRKPRIIKLAGNGTVTMHKEHGVLYRLDTKKVMFSKGNLFERQRLAHKIKNEVVVDMFAGIGYFSLGLKDAKKIYAIEKNPVAFRYLKENIKLNKTKNIKPILGDNRNVKLPEEADRIIMGYFETKRRRNASGSCEKFLKHAVRMLKSKGIVHFHNIYKEKDLWKKPVNEIKKACKGCGIKILQKRRVKSIAPRTWHVVLDIEIRK